MVDFELQVLLLAQIGVAAAPANSQLSEFVKVAPRQEWWHVGLRRDHL